MSAYVAKSIINWVDFLRNESDEDAVAGNVSWSVTAKIDVRSNDAAAVASHDLHSNTGTSFQATSNVGAIPNHTKGNLRVYA